MVYLQNKSSEGKTPTWRQSYIRAPSNPQRFLGVALTIVRLHPTWRAPVILVCLSLVRQNALGGGYGASNHKKSPCLTKVLDRIFSELLTEYQSRTSPARTSFSKTIEKIVIWPKKSCLYLSRRSLGSPTLPVLSNPVLRFWVGLRLSNKKMKYLRKSKFVL